MKISTLLQIAAAIEQVMGVRFKGTVREMTERVSRAAAGLRSKTEAAKAIASEIYNQDFDGSFPATEQAILDAVRAL